MACAVLHTSGRGVGGGLVTARFDRPAALTESQALVELVATTKEFERDLRVTAAHVAAARPEFSSGKTSETQLRPAMHERPFEMMVFFETIGLAEALTVMPEVELSLKSPRLRKSSCSGL
jgi:hypothetical protein